MIHKKRLLAVLLVLAAATASVASASRMDATSQKSAVHIDVVGVAPVPLFALVQYALQKGYFPPSIDVSYKFVTSPVANPLLGGGQVQFALAGSPNFDLLAAGGAPVAWLGAYNTFPDLQFVACCNINSVADLKGKTVGITGPGTLGALLTNEMFARAHFASSDFTIAALGTLGAMQAALNSGSIQGLLSSPPVPQQIAAGLPGAKVIYDYTSPGHGLDWLGAGIAGYMPWVKAHPAATVALLQGLNKAVVNWPKDEAGAEAAVTAYTGEQNQANLAQDWQAVNKDLSKGLVPVPLHTEVHVMQILRDNGFPQAVATLAPKMIAPAYLWKAVPGTKPTAKKK